MEKMKILDMEYKQIYTKSIPYEELRKELEDNHGESGIDRKYDMSIGTVLINKLRFSIAHRRYD